MRRFAWTSDSALELNVLAAQGKLFMTTYALAVDTSLQCFIACEEMGITAEFVPGPLKKLVDARLIEYL